MKKFTKILGLLSPLLLLLFFNTTNAQADAAGEVNSAAADQANNSQQNNSQQNNSDNNQNQQPDEQNGWQETNGKRIYLENNQRVTGLKKLDRDWYLFDKHGYLLTGMQKLPRKNTYSYFAADGRRVNKNTKTKKAYYWINQKGQVTGIRNYAKVISQRPEMPTGCEITAVTMMLNFAGKKVSKFQAAKLMHRSKNPNKGFIGSPYKKYPGGYWVAPKGVKSVIKHYLHRAQVMTRCSISAIKQKLLQSHLVVAWVSGWDHFSNHALALTGFHKNYLYYNDPWTGTKRKMRFSTFKRHWRRDAYRALSY